MVTSVSSFLVSYYGDLGCICQPRLLPNRRGKEVQKGKFGSQGQHTQGSDHTRRQDRGRSEVKRARSLSLPWFPHLEDDMNILLPLSQHPLEMTRKLTPLSLTKEGKGKKAPKHSRKLGRKPLWPQDTRSAFSSQSSTPKSLPEDVRPLTAWGPWAGERFSP